MVQIGSRDIYHMECQMKQGGDIAVRMLEYDVNAALVHGLKAQAYTPEMIAEKGLNILFPFAPVRFRRRYDTIIKMKEKSVPPDKIFGKMDALKKDLTKFITDCIIIINREEENGTLEGRTGADIVEYMSRTCDHLFSKEPELIREVHEVMEPVIKLAREEAENQNPDAAGTSE